MNGTNFNNWLETQLIPNLPPDSTVVLDNASYHTIGENKSLTHHLGSQISQYGYNRITLHIALI
ncbi:hypothetical protein C0J52_21100 [Blattella germanica]|nr:hypothetical protein C0J52_21100 [Blattella germanica]